MFQQTFQLRDLLVVGVLVVLEGVLSVDNALVLGLLARRLPREWRGKALTYGLLGAFAFRIVAVVAASWMMRATWLKVAGGAYLIYLAAKHFFTGSPEHPDPQTAEECQPNSVAARACKGFWSTVLVIEVTDLAFAVDSILAAVALVSGHQPAGSPAIHPKLWVIVTGGMLGVILVRVAAALIIHLLDRFPRLEASAYVLVFLIGLKLLVDWGMNTPGHPPLLDFHSPRHVAFWVFWGLMVVALAIGFLPHKKREASEVAT